MDVFQTERLLLRPLQDSDYTDFRDYASDDQVSHMFGWSKNKSEERIQKIFSALIEGRKTYALVHKSMGKMIGHLTIVPTELPEHLFTKYAHLIGVTMAFAVAPALQRRGLMTEALQAAITDLFLQGKADYIHCGYFAWNHPSQALQEKLGFQPMGSHVLRRKDGEVTILDNLLFRPMKVNGTEYRILRLLGRGKGGYSYLAERGGRHYVLKQIHHEPCSYYTFGDKMAAEQRDYQRLLAAGIPIPAMLEVDVVNERILKEYIDGPTIYELVAEDRMQEHYYHQVRHMAALAYAHGLNIDYFPTNFIVQDEQLYYIDYECNEYMEQWNYENWGDTYWWKSPEFLKYVKEH